MNPVVEALVRHNQDETAEAESKLATAVIAALGYGPAVPSVDLRHFAAWCANRKVRHHPAAPSTIAAFILDRHRAGESSAAILGQIEAIGALHDVTIGNPVVTGIVAAALARIIGSQAQQPPRSWRKDERASFYFLPLWTQATIARREKERDRALRTAQNAAYEKHKQEQALHENKPAHVRQGRAIEAAA